MKRIVLSILLITGVVSADNCSENKKNVTKYENMALATSNLTMGAKYMGMAIKYQKDALDTCFYSAFDKPKIYDKIKDMEMIKRDMLQESYNQHNKQMTIYHKKAY